MRETRMDWIWAQIWEQFNTGNVFEFYVAQSDVDIAEFEATLPPNDPVARSDLTYAKNAHRAQREHFFAALKRRQDERSKLAAIREAYLQQIIKIGFFTIQTLALANGSVVLATLAYLGKDESGSPSLLFITVIVLGALGFLLMLLSGHLSTRFAEKPLTILLELTAINISLVDIQNKTTAVTGLLKKANRITAGLGYASAACLVLALVFGVLSLRYTHAAASPPAKISQTAFTNGETKTDEWSLSD